MIEIYNKNLSPNNAFGILVAQWGGTVEFLNNSPYALIVQGGSLNTTLGPNTNVAYAGMPNGQSFLVTAIGVPVPPATTAINLIVRWYPSEELTPYPPVTGSNIGAPTQVGAQYIQLISSSAITLDTLTFDPAAFSSDKNAVIRIYGFDISGPSNATPNIGNLVIRRTYDPVRKIVFGNIIYVLNQTANGISPTEIRPPFALQSAPGNTLELDIPSLSTVGGEINTYFAVY